MGLSEKGDVMPQLKPEDRYLNYRIIRVVDPKDETSGWTASYLAEDSACSNVVITFLNKEKILERFSDGPEAYRRKIEQFKKEAEFLKGVTHSHIAMTYESSCDNQSQEPFIVKEYLTSVSLYDAVRGGLNPMGAAWFLQGLLEALHYLHTQKKVLH